ncbi:MAG TPA: isoprenylcysteine carboxylmethyltransferase family protein [Pirellulales bacterium]|nr:isoprenylcysteine carboxylmethyltransferase family protein [Pirellulales bacterium]
MSTMHTLGIVPTTSETASVSSGQAELPAWMARLLHFFIRRRIFISLLLFSALIVEDILTGVRPHNLFNFTDHATVLGLVLVNSGVLMRSWAAGILRKDKEVTTSGPYRVVRNPLYLGSFLMMAGFCELIGDPENIFFVLGPMILLYSIKVRNEEQWLSKLFPTAWAEYARQTPRFLPRFARTDIVTHWRRTQWIASREYQAVLATMVALVAIKLWYALA